MIIDARQLPVGSQLKAKLCIIGGGMAGIAIARELMDAGGDILILESGGEAQNADIQALYNGRGSMTDPDGRVRDMTTYLPSSRIRAFGGSGHVWGGKCGPLDPSDFEARDWIPGSGWPFDRSHLDPFYDRACKHLDLPSFRRDLISGDASRPAFKVGDGSEFETVPRFHSKVSGVQNKEKFDAYRYSTTSSPRVTVCLHANVTQVQMTSDGRAVKSLEVRTMDGRTHSAVADHYVLATGGMENARVLMLSNQTLPKGVGNDRDLVGRYFCGHLNASLDEGDKGKTTGIAIPSLASSFDLYTTGDINKVWGIWHATTRMQRKYRVPNSWIAFQPRWYDRTPSEQGVLRLANATSKPVAGGTSDFFPFRIMAEDLPNAASRLTLDTGARDALGQARLALDWRLSEGQYDGMQRTVARLAASISANGGARVRWPLTREKTLTQLSPARHHVGTTRMHTDRARGVVDEHCRVHGVANLHIAGSSVFPTSGIVNPTLTLIALAVRLSDRLRPSLRRSA